LRAIYLSWRFAHSTNRIRAHEDLHKKRVSDPGRGNVHGIVRGGQAGRLQKERQELPHERQQGVQLREELRLQGSQQAQLSRTFREIDNHQLQGAIESSKPSISIRR